MVLVVVMVVMVVVKAEGAVLLGAAAGPPYTGHGVLSRAGITGAAGPAKRLREGRRYRRCAFPAAGSLTSE